MSEQVERPPQEGEDATPPALITDFNRVYLNEYKEIKEALADSEPLSPSGQKRKCRPVSPMTRLKCDVRCSPENRRRRNALGRRLGWAFRIEFQNFAYEPPWHLPSPTTGEW
jgi:hypothetical protein